MYNSEDGWPGQAKTELKPTQDCARINAPACFPLFDLSTDLALEIALDLDNTLALLLFLSEGLDNGSISLVSFLGVLEGTGFTSACRSVPGRS